MENTITTKVTPDSTSEKAGIVGYGSGGNAIYGNTGSTTAITADKLKPIQPVVLPQKQTDTTADQLSGFIASTTQSNKTQAQREFDMMNQQTQQVKDTTGRDLNATLQSILGTNTEIGNVESTVDRTEQDRALKEYNNYTSQIEAEQLANRRAIESMQKNNPQGLFGGALQDEVARINRDSVSKQADLAILQNVSNRNYATAAQIADRQVEMKLKPLQTKLENLKFFYDANKSRFDKADDRLYANKIKEVDREYEQQKEKEQLASQMKLAGYKAKLQSSLIAQRNGAAPETVASIAQNGDPIEIVRNAVLKTKNKKGDASLQDALGVLISARDLAFSNKEGEFKGLAPILRKPGIFQSKEGRTNRQYVEAINLKTQQWASGASLTKEQTKQVSKLTPDKNDTDQQVKDKLNGLTKFMLGQAQASLANQGVSIEIPEIDYFAPSNDPLNIDNTSNVMVENDELGLFDLEI